MTITDAIEQIDAWATRQDSSWPGIPRLMRAMCVGARREDVPDATKELVRDGRELFVRGALAMKTHACSRPDTCQAAGGCFRFVISAQTYLALAVAMRCMEKSGPDFPMPEAWPADDDIQAWTQQLADLNGLELVQVPRPEAEVTVVHLSPEPGESITDALERALREKKIDAQTKKQTVQ